MVDRDCQLRHGRRLLNAIFIVQMTHIAHVCSIVCLLWFLLTTLLTKLGSSIHILQHIHMPEPQYANLANYVKRYAAHQQTLSKSWLLF